MDIALLATLILFPTLFLFIAVGLPISVSILFASLITGLATLGFDTVYYITPQKIFNNVDSFALLAISLFMLAGNIMNQGGIARKLINLALLLGGRLPASLAHANIIANMLFGTLSGSALACCSAIGGTMAPMMKENKYEPGFSAAVNIASAPTGILIPPSGLFILFSLVSGGAASVADLFLAGWIPGIMWGLGLMFVTFFIGKRLNLASAGERPHLSLIFTSFLDALPSLMLIVIIIGGIVGGIFTATEGAGIAVLYSLALTIVYKSMNLEKFFKILIDTALMSGVILFLIAASGVMSYVMVSTKIPAAIADILLMISDNKIILLLIINVLLLIIGTFMDITPAVLIFTPILMPICVNQLGMDPVHFGVMMIANMAIGSTTPPVGTVLFLGSSIANTKVEKVIPYLLPMFAATIIVLLLITFIPSLSLFIPSLLGS